MRRFGLVGRSLKHSFSKAFFEQKFKDEALAEHVYENYELSSIQQLVPLIQSKPDLAGLNITIPYKEEVVGLLTEVHPLVKSIGACNCIRIGNGRLQGFNTDATAFESVVRKHLKPKQECALILGTGGASRAVQFALKQLSIDFLVVSRNKHGAQIGYEDVGEDVVGGHQIVINTTPLGMYPDIDNDPPLPYEAINNGQLFIDLIYNPAETSFLKKAREGGAVTVNGAEMLRLQAEESWKIWNDSSL